MASDSTPLENNELDNTSHCDAQTQWIDLELEDHNYSKKLSIQSSSDTEIATVSNVTESAKKPASDSIVANDADSFLYTGLSFLVFHTIMLCLQPFAPHSVSMPIIDYND